MTEVEPTSKTSNDARLDGTDDIVAMGDDNSASVETPKRKKYGKFVLGFTALSALIIGGASGGGFVQYVMPHIAPSLISEPNHAAVSGGTDLTPLNTEIKQLTDVNTALEKRLIKLEAAFKNFQKNSQAAQASVLKPIDLSDITLRLDKLEDTLDAPSIDEGLLTRLEALQDDGSPALDLSAIEVRLDALETTNETDEIFSVVQENLQNLYDKQAQTYTQITALSGDLESIQVQLEDAQAAMSETKLSAAELLSVSAAGLPFPKQALLDAVDAQAQKKPLLKRALGKHIKIKDPSDPSVIIAAIETDLARGNMAAAALRFDSLPPEIQSVASAWRNSLN